MRLIGAVHTFKHEANNDWSVENNQDYSTTLLIPQQVKFSPPNHSDAVPGPANVHNPYIFMMNK